MSEGAAIADPAVASTPGRRRSFALVYAIFVAGLCSIIYELLISTVSSYFLGDSVKQFSLTIGIYMAAMGIGAWISRSIRGPLIPFFIGMEIVLGLIGGLSVPFLYAIYSVTPEIYGVSMVLLIAAIGILIGLEIPLLTRILERYHSLRVNISTVLSFDYLGALLATLVFPFILLPLVGVFRSSIIFGSVNMSIGFVLLFMFRDQVASHLRRRFCFAAAVVSLLLLGLLTTSGRMLDYWSSSLYDDTVIYNEQTPYQKLVLTRYQDDLRFFINGNLQFASSDEYRYHESLVHIPAARAGKLHHVLLLGGGDGLALREILKYPDIESVTLVDLDPAVTQLGRENPLLADLNQNSLEDPRVDIIHTDALSFLESTERTYNLILADLPDPNHTSLARLYSHEFYDLVHQSLTADGVFTTQATSPYFAREAFWTIVNTVDSSRLHGARPYHVYVPSFGEWGFVMAFARPADRPEPSPLSPSLSLRFLAPGQTDHLFDFPPDLRRPTETLAASTLDDPKVLHRYLKSWDSWR